jgi:predicted GIY-YIG superfamily endonuclease
MRGIGARFVYVLESDSDPGRHYTGVTSDVDNRLEWHNHGPSGHTANHRPWSLQLQSSSRPRLTPGVSSGI